jgi:hypothetical protein
MNDQMTIESTFIRPGELQGSGELVSDQKKRMTVNGIFQPNLISNRLVVKVNHFLILALESYVTFFLEEDILNFSSTYQMYSGDLIRT